MNIINENFQKAKTIRSDINEHIDTLYKYAKECEHITECGTRAVVTSWAFAKGLMDNKSENKTLIS